MTLDNPYWIVSSPGNAAHVYGPFDTEKGAARWGRECLLDERWNVIQADLSVDYHQPNGAVAMLRLIDPDDPEANPCAYP